MKAVQKRRFYFFENFFENGGAKGAANWDLY
jgi:hypothetical protein